MTWLKANMSPPSKSLAMKKASPRPSNESRPMAKAPTKELAWTACVRLDRAEHAKEDSEWLCYLAEQKHAEAQLKHNKAQLRLAKAELELADAKLALGKSSEPK
jgi:hypothetical protein